MRHWISRADVGKIAVGAAFLGTGGGGNVLLGAMKLRRLLQQGYHVEVISVDEISMDDLGIGFSGMGAPTIDVEKMANGDEGMNAVRAVERYLGHTFEFLVVGEIGGANALEALYVGAKMGLPVVDADPMGRAFPELEMDTFMINGVAPNPLGLADSHGTTTVLGGITDALRAEHYARALTIAMGGSAALAMPVVKGWEVRDHAVIGSLSLAHHLGQLLERQKSLEGLLGELAAAEYAIYHLAEGKIVDLERRTAGGFARGKITILDGDRTYTVLLQNEFLALLSGEQVLASVPDLITLVDHDSGQPISTDQLHYGMRVAVLGIPAPAQLKTEAALAVVGPSAFNYPFSFCPLVGSYPKAPWFEEGGV